MKFLTTVSLLFTACLANGSILPHPDTLSTQSSSLVSFSGAKAVLLGWHLQSILHVEDDVNVLSKPDYDVSSWYRVSSRATVMAGLIENGIYNDMDLFYSNNLQTNIKDLSVFQSPWLYREEFMLDKLDRGQHVFINTHGITAQANIFVNGALIASRDVQRGSYGGHRYEITSYLSKGKNCVLIKAYPANYDEDLVIGFADWNPYPPDNGTGVWRNVELLQTGPVSISPPRVITSTPADMRRAEVTVKMEIDNHEEHDVSGIIIGVVRSEDQKQALPLSQAFTLQAHESKTIAITAQLHNPQIWWPASWGEQPLYTAQLNVTTNSANTSSAILSDIGEPRNFGIRHVSSHLNEHNDRAFTVNGRPFLVLGAGYSPDYFLRFDENRVRVIFDYMLDLGLNTVRLEGKLEHPEFFDLADRMGLMVIAGWECCDKWEAFDYNDDVNSTRWRDSDYTIANHSMLHEAMQLQAHPSILAFLVGSDYWPNDTAAEIYLSALHQKDWKAPIIASASQRGHPGEIIEDSGMKMAGPYDWVPPNYWYQEDDDDAEGAAFGFGSELGAGVGTPELDSLVKFLSEGDLIDLWTKPDNVGLFHMSNEKSQFYGRDIYNKALWARYGEPDSLVDYVFKAQVMDYEATRAQFEAFSIRQNAERPATGMIYWMLNSAWPNLHWQLFDYYLKPGGAYFGAKTGCRAEHVAYDYVSQGIYIINHTPNIKALRNVIIDIIDVDGKSLFHDQVHVETSPFSSILVTTIPQFNQDEDSSKVVFMRLILEDASHMADKKIKIGEGKGGGNALSRNMYWLSPNKDVLEPDNATWYSTPVSDYADFTALTELPRVKVKSAIVSVTTTDNKTEHDTSTGKSHTITMSLENTSDSLPAFFMRLALLDASAGNGNEIVPASWEDNYVTLWPKERMNVVASVGMLGFAAASKVVLGVDGGNVEVEIDGDGEIHLQRGCC